MRQNRSKDTPQAEQQNDRDILEIVEQLAELLVRSDLSDVRIREDTLEIHVSRTHGTPDSRQQGPPHPAETPAPVAAPPHPVASAQPEEHTGGAAAAESDAFINAPMPSRFYRSPAPEEPPFVTIGDTVETGEPIAILEVMKTYNPVEAPFTCQILEILAEDAEAVEYAQPLFRVKQV